MSVLVQAQGVNKYFGKQHALHNIDLSIERGKIVGLVGHNGAGKTTLLKCLLGLSPCEGQLEVLGLEPKKDRTKLMENVCFIADTAILPRWLKVKNAVDFLQGVHPKFDREKALGFLQSTDIEPNKTVAKLSKGMITQLHLALVMSIDVPLLVLDEPTLGLDILYRSQFYNSLLDDYFDQERTIIIATHQVEEIESLVTDLVFLRNGVKVLDSSMDEVANRFVQVQVHVDQAEQARALGPIHETSGLGRKAYIYEDQAPAKFANLGEVRTPKIADLFMAKMKAE